ncbi:unnamed protein product [Gongylonema pulchrum]|uniref:Tnp_DDE_dom domain-containing protein n=1 Tax=Gongylonema pulchrum TaxID=637853 RepID=A0A183D9K1_9BILA|nr:unnamed protein product [Gongylonema pulchrum]
MIDNGLPTLPADFVSDNRRCYKPTAISMLTLLDEALGAILEQRLRRFKNNSQDLISAKPILVNFCFAQNFTTQLVVQANLDRRIAPSELW